MLLLGTYIPNVYFLCDSTSVALLLGSAGQAIRDALESAHKVGKGKEKDNANVSEARDQW